MLKLFDCSFSGNCYKIRLLLNQLGREYKRIEVDILHGGTETPDFQAMNRNGRVPVLEVEPGVYLAESNAILFYLAEGTPFLSNNTLERARVLQWMFFEQYSHEPNIATSRFWVSILKVGEERKAELEKKKIEGYKALDVMESHLKENNFFAGGQYGIADIALFGYTHTAEDGGFELNRYPAILRWIEDVKNQKDHIAIDDLRG